MTEKTVEGKKNGGDPLSRLQFEAPEEASTSDEPEKKSEDGKKEEDPSISIFQVYRYATNLDYCLLAVGITLCMAQGGFNSVNSLIFRHLVDALIEGQTNWTLHSFDYPVFEHKAMHAIIQYVYYGFIVFTSAFLSMTCWHVLCERQVHAIRIRFFRAILRQEVGYFDKNAAGSLTTQLSDGIDRVRDGIGDKLGLTFTLAVQFVGGLTVAFTYSWKMSLVLLGLLPFMLGSIAGIGIFSKRFIKKEQKCGQEVGAIGEEVLNGIRTVIAFNGQPRETERYDDALRQAESAGNKKGMVMAIGTGCVFFLIFFSMGIAFWYGTKLVVNGEVSPGRRLQRGLVGDHRNFCSLKIVRLLIEKERVVGGFGPPLISSGRRRKKPNAANNLEFLCEVFACFWAFLVALFSVAQCASQIPALLGAQTAAAKIFAVIDRDPEIDSTSLSGEQPAGARGSIELEDVRFRYPSRPDVEVLKGLSLTAEPGQVVALVGQSGSGKSTIVNLLQRFYDVAEGDGSIRVDGHEVKDLNVRFLRNLIGVVQQEPVLFAATVAENVRLGNLLLTDEEMHTVCRQANAFEFITALPDGFNTRIGEGGVVLSGGQKQRLAIARALSKDPRILLLDEATSALDTNSERIVQEALEKASAGRTTIVVAHRLSTIKNANQILVMERGEVRERGTHDELMAMDGIYATMVRAQEIQKLKEVDEDGDERVKEAEKLERSDRKRRSRRLSRAISATSTAPERDADLDRLVDEAEETDSAGLLTIIRFARKEWPLLIVATLAAMIRGTSLPLFSIIYGQIFKTLSLGSNEEKLHKAVMNLVFFCILGAGAGIAAFVTTGLFIRAGESITRRLRLALFENILKQDGAYFDHLDHAAGKLSARLSTDAPNVRAAIDQRLADVIHAASAIVVGIVIAFSYGWKMAPIGIFTAGFLSCLQTAVARYLKSRGNEDAKLAEEPSRLASEVIDHQKTVQSLGREETFDERFTHLNARPHRRAITRGIIQALTYAFQSAYVFFNFAAAYRFGVFLVSRREVDPYTVFQVIEALNCAAMSLMAVATYFPEYVRARLSASILFKMLEDVPAIQSPPVGDHQRAGDWSEVTFDSVDFAYPMNKKSRVLRNCDLHIARGKTIALVGHSGCGKSTVIQLLERFYDPDAGAIRIYEADLKKTDLMTHRSHIALVGQEPILFNYTIEENIAYGLKNVGMERIIEAAKQANCHQFITQLPEGYKTIVGEKGSRISGGQKQRIAIARAIVRQPRILLLDEATSALDSESEKIVQEALEKARVGRTSIVIAHRLSTIQTADLIVVVEGGRVVETGTHQSLLALDGKYASLTKQQCL